MSHHHVLEEDGLVAVEDLLNYFEDASIELGMLDMISKYFQYIKEKIFLSVFSNLVTVFSGPCPKILEKSEVIEYMYNPVYI